MRKRFLPIDAWPVSNLITAAAGSRAGVLRIRPSESHGVSNP